MLGEQIKKLRTKNSLSMRALAEKSKISKSTLNDIETGKVKSPSITTLQKIVDALGVSLDYLTRKSTRAIIEDKLEVLNMTFQDLSNKTKIPMSFFDNLDNINPDESDYGRVQLIAKFLDIDSSILLKALANQEPPVYDGPKISVAEAFKTQEDSAKSVTLNKNDEKDIAKDVNKIMKKLEQKEDGPVFYEGIEIHEDDLDLFKDALELALKRIKIKNKDKYTPKKYKK